jgi:hypothetical protein
MERSTWTDERLDDRFNQIDRRFDQLDARLDRLEVEMRDGFAELRTLVFRSNVAMMIGFLGVIAAVLTRGTA